MGRITPCFPRFSTRLFDPSFKINIQSMFPLVRTTKKARRITEMGQPELMDFLATCYVLRGQD